MGMPFEQVLKGRNAESSFVALLEQQGYHVVRTGVETLIQPVKRLDLRSYLRLGLPVPLRKMPDLLVLTADNAPACMVEVKYRRVFDAATARELVRTLAVQHAAWPGTYVAILLGRPIIPGGRYHQDYLRILPLARLEELVTTRFDLFRHEGMRMRAIWEGLPQLQDVFRYFYQSDDNRLRGRQGQYNADLMVRVLGNLAA
jgi:hypothetical protein